MTKTKSPEQAAREYIDQFAWAHCTPSDVEQAFIIGYARAKAELLDGEPDGYCARHAHLWQVFETEDEAIEAYGMRSDWQIKPVKIIPLPEKPQP